MRISHLLALLLAVAVISSTAHAQAVGPRTINLGPGCGVPPPVLTVTAPALGATAAIQVMSDFPNAHGFLAASLPTTVFTEIAPDCFVYLDLASLFLVSEYFTDGDGNYVLGLPLPNDPALAGLEFNLQTRVWAAGGPFFGDHASNGVAIRTGVCDECDGKVTSLTLAYLGNNPNAVIEVKQKNGDVVFNGLVMPGGLFSFSGLESDGTFDNEIKIRVNGGPETKIHTSCSKPIGPGLVVNEFEVIEGTSRLGGPLCPIGPCDEGKPCALILRYTGADCSVSTNAQDPGKLFCSGDPAGAATVFIRASDKDDPNDSGARVWFEGPVGLGETFMINASAEGEDKLTSETHLHIFDQQGGALLQQLEFHTSCSQPLSLFDRFGSVTLEGFFAEGQCGSTPGSPDLCDGGEKPCALELVYTGADCSVTSHSQDPSKVFCAGDPANAATVFIRASDDDDATASGANVWFEGNVNLGESFLIESLAAGEDKLQSETHLHIFDQQGGTLLQQIEFHTSCSQPLFIGNRFGAIDLAAFFAEGTCSNPSNPMGSNQCDGGAKPAALTLTYTGDSCAATSHSQDPSKVFCSGDPAFLQQVVIRASDDEDPNESSANVWFSGPVTLGLPFDITAANANESRLKNETHLHIFDMNGNLLQQVEFHTSCSQPLFIGNQFGSIRLDAFIPE